MNWVDIPAWQAMVMYAGAVVLYEAVVAAMGHALRRAEARFNKKNKTEA